MHLRFLFQTSLRLLKVRSSALGSESLGIRSKLFILEQLELVESFQKSVYQKRTTRLFKCSFVTPRWSSLTLKINKK